MERREERERAEGIQNEGETECVVVVFILIVLFVFLPPFFFSSGCLYFFDFYLFLCFCLFHVVFFFRPVLHFFLLSFF